MPARRRSRLSRSRPRVARSLRSTSSRAVASSCSESSCETAASISVESTPLVRSSWTSARRASPRPWCRDSTQASANALSLISPTSSNRDSTSSAASSGISRLRRASASCFRVRGVPVSRRRQIARARSTGSAGGSPFSALDEEGPPPSSPGDSPKPRRRCRRPREPPGAWPPRRELRPNAPEPRAAPSPDSSPLGPPSPYVPPRWDRPAPYVRSSPPVPSTPYDVAWPNPPSAPPSGSSPIRPMPYDTERPCPPSAPSLPPPGPAGPPSPFPPHPRGASSYSAQSVRRVTGSALGGRSLGLRRLRSRRSRRLRGIVRGSGHRGVRTRLGSRLLRPHADAQLLQDLLLDLVGQVGVVLQEVAGVLLALAELVALVRVPGAGLADEAVLHAHVDQAALAADALSVEDVELGLLEGRRDLVLDDLDAGAVADR